MSGADGNIQAGLNQRVFAWALARFNRRYEQFVSRYKRQLFADISGSVLEMGAGTGANRRYLMPERVNWIGVEPNPFMPSYIRSITLLIGTLTRCRLATAALTSSSARSSSAAFRVRDAASKRCCAS
jgi:hypothetical protein